MILAGLFLLHAVSAKAGIHDPWDSVRKSRYQVLGL